MTEPEVKSPTKIITSWDLFKVFLASFFVQAVWNFRSLISIGFSISFFPVLNKLCKTPEAKRELFQRHLKFFNAHPYFASYALGVSIRLEEMRLQGHSDAPEIIDRIKDMLISPLGAVGDRLFWATIKPACLVLGMTGLLIAQDHLLKIVVLTVSFLAYNIPHFYYRYEGIIAGYRSPLDIHRYIGQQRFERIRKIFVLILVASLLIFVAVYTFRLFKINPSLIFFFIFPVFYTLLFNRISRNFYWVTFATFIFFLVAAVLFL